MNPRYKFDINIASTDELAGIGYKLEDFMRELGEGSELDVNVTIGSESAPINTHAIGFVVYAEEDYEEDGE